MLVTVSLAPLGGVPIKVGVPIIGAFPLNSRPIGNSVTFSLVEIVFQ